MGDEISKRKHLDEVDIALGITMLLVVFGHMHFLSTAGVRWYEEIRSLIYYFHMSVFLFFMGFLFAYTKDIYSPRFNHWHFCLKKTAKFGKPFLFFAVVYYLIDLILAENRSDYLSLFWHDLYKQFLQPAQAHPTFLWFIYVLLLYYLTIPLITRFAPRWANLILIVIGVIFIFFRLPAFLSLELYGKHFLFFILGIQYNQYKEKVDLVIRKTGLGFLILFLVGAVIYFYFKWADYVIFSILAIISVLFLSEKMVRSRMFKVIGENTFPVYLQNTTIIGICFILITRVLGLPVKSVAILFPVIVFLAIFIPLLLKKVLPVKPKILREVLGYI